MKRPTGILAMIALSSFLLCGSTAPATCHESFGPSAGEVVGVAVAVGAVIVVTVVLVEVNHAHHTVKGCVTSGPGGIQVMNQSDKKIYVLAGSPANVKVGDIVKLHGKREKQDKSNPAPQEFLVQKLTKDYGPCPATAPVSGD